MKFITTIEFKSIPEFYEKEAEGVKSNTVRIVSKEEDKLIVDHIGSIKYIRIVNTNTVACIKSFLVELTDITRFESYGLIMYIFSW